MRDHPSYHEWQTGTVCLFVGEDDRVQAQSLADQELKRRGWQRIKFTERSTLIEARVREAGGEVWNAYLEAKSGKIVAIEGLDRIPFLRKGDSPTIVAPRLTEAFVDNVIERAGGRRLTDEEANFRKTPNADYRIGRFILELKDLQEEALEVRSRQQDIANLARSDRGLVVDPASLTEEQFGSYATILGRPIRKRLQSARHQVRATLDHLEDSEPSLQGGAIILNSGYGTMPPDLLYELARSYVEPSTTLQFVVCISCWSLTDGFDTTVQFAFLPDEREHQPIAALRTAFWDGIDSLMHEWARSGFRAEGPHLDPLRPLVFEDAGDSFGILAPQPQSSFDSEAHPTKNDAV